MPRYNKATLMPCQWVMFFLLAFRSFQGCVPFRSFQGCVPFVPAAAVASRSKIFMGLQDIVCARCPRGGGVHRERQAAAGYRFCMVFVAARRRLVLLFFVSIHTGPSVSLPLA